jgi:hypothetical protein
MNRRNLFQACAAGLACSVLPVVAPEKPVISFITWTHHPSGGAWAIAHWEDGSATCFRTKYEPDNLWPRAGWSRPEFLDWCVGNDLYSI